MHAFTLVHKQMLWIRMNLRMFQPSNGKCNIRMFFILPYKEICWLKLYMQPWYLYMCTLKQVKKDNFTIISSSHFIKGVIFALYVL